MYIYHVYVFFCVASLRFVYSPVVAFHIAPLREAHIAQRTGMSLLPCVGGHVDIQLRRVLKLLPTNFTSQSFLGGGKTFSMARIHSQCLV